MNNNVLKELDIQNFIFMVFIITTLSNIELKKLSEISDYPGKNAREIMNLALNYPSNFEFVLLEKYYSYYLIIFVLMLRFYYKSKFFHFSLGFLSNQLYLKLTMK